MECADCRRDFDLLRTRRACRRRERCRGPRRGSPGLVHAGGPRRVGPARGRPRPPDAATRRPTIHPRNRRLRARWSWSSPAPKPRRASPSPSPGGRCPARAGTTSSCSTRAVASRRRRRRAGYVRRAGGHPWPGSRRVPVVGPRHHFHRAHASLAAAPASPYREVARGPPPAPAGMIPDARLSRSAPMGSARPFLRCPRIPARAPRAIRRRVRGFRWPALDRFNWALDWFDALRRGATTAPALRIVRDDGAERGARSPSSRERSNRVANALRRARRAARRPAAAHAAERRAAVGDDARAP